MTSEYVTVSHSYETALSEPVFIVEKGGFYYLTRAVLEYTPNAETPLQQAGGEQIANFFSQKPEKLQAVEVPLEVRGIFGTCASNEPNDQNPRF